MEACLALVATGLQALGKDHLYMFYSSSGSSYSLVGRGDHNCKECSQSIIEGDAKDVIRSISDSSKQVNWKIWQVIEVIRRCSKL